MSELIDLLERRLTVIGDAELRERNPEAQMAQLREVSEAIAAFHERHREEIPARLNHFLANASYGKALDWARAERES
ncbi:MAG: hypothetical protein WD342_20050 [Verrucomicrobiales bacterium]